MLPVSPAAKRARRLPIRDVYRAKKNVDRHQQSRTDASRHNITATQTPSECTDEQDGRRPEVV